MYLSYNYSLHRKLTFMYFFDSNRTLITKKLDNYMNKSTYLSRMKILVVSYKRPSLAYKLITRAVQTRIFLKTERKRSSPLTLARRPSYLTPPLPTIPTQLINHKLIMKMTLSAIDYYSSENIDSHTESEILPSYLLSNML
ncbi:glucose transporter type 1 isoform X6 [Vespula maculifrons]|uniref:Glucose transporter type 1 isoform X6 n=1 Tax=Vespula maculifrons TaxID=7453 RepID=A0ABD2CRL7_VESMC